MLNIFSFFFALAMKHLHTIINQNQPKCVRNVRIRGRGKTSNQQQKVLTIIK